MRKKQVCLASFSFQMYHATMKVLIAMSGGVDSSVAAYILKKQGYECVGATMKLYSPLEDIEDAKAVASKLDIPHYVFDFGKEFQERVIRPFVDAYENGRTPNPCVICNRFMKFGILHEKAKELGCDYIASGHYARIEQGTDSVGDVRYYLKKSANQAKDQSYVLSMLTQDQLAHSLFPLEDISKDVVRQIAIENGFGNANKPESQDICFVPDGKYAEFIEEYEGKTFPEGNFCDECGNVVGTHKGIIRYTVGQRKGLGIALGKPAYVKRIDPDTNRVYLCDNEALFTDTLVSEDFNWISVASPYKPFHAKARIRYQHKEQPASIIPEADGSVTIRFDTPQRAITPGQTVVVYDGEYVVGGGTIK